MSDNDFHERIKLTFFQEYANHTRHLEQLLYQRFNYFLIATSFLAAAFATLAISSTQWTWNLSIDNHSLLWIREPHFSCVSISLAYLVSCTGIILSWFFASSNMHNSKIIFSCHNGLQKTEQRLMVHGAYINRKNLPYFSILTKAKNKNEWTCRSFVAPILDIHLYNKLPGPHTWLIPIFFTAFWFIAIGLYSFWLRNWLPVFIIIGIVIAFVLVSLLCSSEIRKRIYHFFFKV
jgi:hypothetical protein